MPRGLTIVIAAILLAIPAGVRADVVAVGKAAPEFAHGAWINSAPLTLDALRGRVVLIDFWTFG